MDIRILQPGKLYKNHGIPLCRIWISLLYRIYWLTITGGVDYNKSDIRSKDRRFFYPIPCHPERSEGSPAPPPLRVILSAAKDLLHHPPPCHPERQRRIFWTALPCTRSFAALRMTSVVPFKPVNGNLPLRTRRGGS